MIFAFGDHELDDERFELRRAGRVVAIQPKTFEVLLHLVRHRDRVVSKQEILEAVWPDAAVTDGSLARAVSLARLALGDRARTPAVIVTVPRRGYKFEAPVRHLVSPVEALAAGGSDPRSRYVGRAALLARLGAVVGRALAGEGRIVFLAGEAGIGKTRTAQVLTTLAQKAGAVTATASGAETGAPSLRRWTRVLRAVASALPEAAAGLAESQRAALERVLPGPGGPGPLAVTEDEGEASRFRLFEAAQAFLAAAARRRPLALFLEDLHEVDAESLWLLEFLGQEIGALPIAIVVTCREREAGPTPEHARALARLLRVTSLERWPLTGLHGEEVRDFVRPYLGADPEPELVLALEGKTSGNPLLLGESLRSLEARGLLEGRRTRNAWEALLPSGIRHLLEPKLRVLSPRALEVLGRAASIGVELDRALLSRCLADDSDLDEPLRELEDAGLLFATRPTGGLRFPHALVREALDAELVPAGDGRRALHARIAAALDELEDASEGSLFARAHHACEAVPRVDPARACALARAAGEQAARLHDFEGAASWCQRALRALDAGAGDPVTRAALCLDLGAAQARAMGLEPARQSYRQAAEHARAAAREDLLAAAALGFAHRPHSSGYGDREAIELLEQAAEALGGGNDALRIRLESRLAAEIRYHDRPRAEALAERAIAAARRLGDSAVLAQVLDDACYVRWSPADPSGWVELNAEVARVAQSSRHSELVLEGLKGCVTGWLELGDLAAVDREIRACERAADALRTPYARWLCAAMHAMRAILDGDLAGADRRAGEAIRIGARVDSAEVALELQTQLVGLRLEQGRAAEIESAARSQAERFPDAPAWRAAWARVLVGARQLVEARRELARLARRRFSDVPRDRGWLPTLALASEVACATGDVGAAEILEEILAPYARLAVVAGTGVLYYGSVSHHLGLLALARSRWDAAIAHFESALASEEQVSARIWAARTRVAHARALLGRDAPGDRARAAALASEAMTTARSHRLVAVLEEARDLEESVWTRRRATRTRQDAKS